MVGYDEVDEMDEMEGGEDEGKGEVEEELKEGVETEVGNGWVGVDNGGAAVALGGRSELLGREGDKIDSDDAYASGNRATPSTMAIGSEDGVGMVDGYGEDISGDGDDNDEFSDAGRDGSEEGWVPE